MSCKVEGREGVDDSMRGVWGEVPGDIRVCLYA